MGVNMGSEPNPTCSDETAYLMGQQAFENNLEGRLPSDDPVMKRYLDTLGKLEQMTAWGDYQQGWLDAAAKVPASEYDFGDEDYNDEPGPSWRECWHGWLKGECPNCYPDPTGRGGGREEVGY